MWRIFGISVILALASCAALTLYFGIPEINDSGIPLGIHAGITVLTVSALAFAINGMLTSMSGVIEPIVFALLLGSNSAYIESGLSQSYAEVNTFGQVDFQVLHLILHVILVAMLYISLRNLRKSGYT